MLQVLALYPDKPPRGGRAMGTCMNRAPATSEMKYSVLTVDGGICDRRYRHHESASPARTKSPQEETQMNRRQAESAAFDPFAIATGHNGGPPLDDEPANDNQTPFDALKTELDDLFDEAKNFCDGEPIDSDEMATAITELHDRIHECGTRAEALRVAEKKPLDDKVAAIQAKFHPLIGNTKAGKGKVVLGKDACQSLLTPWRKKVADEKAAEAAKKAAEAAAATKAAEDAIRSSSGNLSAREEAEELLADAKKLERGAKRADKAATTGLGLRSVWNVNIADDAKALDWAFEHAPGEFMAMALSLAEEQVRKGVRSIEGFSIVEDKVAR
ncbi:hypothetical protein AAIH70_11550 [Neorhizobium sp. BT27B]|uniref:hypothetical protein n=1 Tax=Neorhizobium sp. BT27B TaxID=3142625 RepID=UPI003D29BB19